METFTQQSMSDGDWFRTSSDMIDQLYQNFPSAPVAAKEAGWVPYIGEDSQIHYKIKKAKSNLEEHLAQGKPIIHKGKPYAEYQKIFVLRVVNGYSEVFDKEHSVYITVPITEFIPIDERIIQIYG